jgi:hypothetical protein
MRFASDSHTPLHHYLGHVLHIAAIKKAADSGINGGDGEVLKYRGKGGAHFHSGPLEPFPR